MATIGSLDELADMVEHHHDLYVRWSRGPQVDSGGSSRDDLTEVPLPGLSANPLAVEEWWQGRPPRMWVARRLYDYRHLRDERGPGVRPWVMVGRERGRGPDNEPLVECVRPIAWIDDRVIEAAVAEIENTNDDWGPLRRRPEEGARG